MTTQSNLSSTVVDLFSHHYGRQPDGVWSAPGRVNLIGEHTDYNNGWVLPFAIDRRTWCAVGHRSDRVMTAVSALTGDRAEVNLDGLSPESMSGWSAYVFGVAWALGEMGVDLSQRAGFDAAIVSDVPLGAGLSSSAALECAIAIALNDEWELGLSRDQLARACQLAENRAVGAPTGIMDQTASLQGEEGAAVLLDCESLTSELVPLDLASAGLIAMVIDTRVEHAHATGGYAARRRSCDNAVAALGVTSLRELTSTDLPRAQALLDDETYRRVRHVVTENARVIDTAVALRAAGPRSIGDLMAASHASMRDDFEISVPELDVAVDAAVSNGAVGARMTGGGFGGSAIVLVPSASAERTATAVRDAFAAYGFTSPTVFAVVPSHGARREHHARTVES